MTPLAIWRGFGGGQPPLSSQDVLGRESFPLPGPLPLAKKKDRGGLPPQTPPLRPQRVRLTLPDSFSRAHARRVPIRMGPFATGSKETSALQIDDFSLR